MSLYIEGLPAASVSFQRSPKSSLSSTFYQNLVGVSGNRLLLTTTIPNFSSYSSLVECNISHGLQTDVVLGLDWAAHVRESLICSGYRLDSTFDAWCFFSYPTHPINGLRALPPSSSSAGNPVNSPSTSNATGAITPSASVPNSSRTGSAFNHDHNNNSEINSETLNSDTRPHTHTPSSRQAPVKFVSYVPPQTTPSVPGPSKPSSPVPTISVERRGVEALERLLLSPDETANIFTMNGASLSKLLTMHHIEPPTAFSCKEARHAILCHLLAGSCFGTVFPSSQAMTFSVLSLLISASDDRLPDIRVEAAASCLGQTYSSRIDFQQHLGRKRQKLVQAQSAAQSARSVFDNLENLSKGSLSVIAQTHGIRLGKSPTREQLRYAIVHHLGTESQFEPFTAQPGTAEDPATLLQIHIIRQIAPVLQLRPLRRLLDLHDVVYLESDTVKLLRRRLNKFLERLIRGKYGDNELSLTGSIICDAWATIAFDLEPNVKCVIRLYGV
ncbi:hypothetical protein B0H13DRAFT_2343466 [Mycena leptocephala]|nr:hypothetical protein B0H13DRAFT_2343466 [Mycena leptocephala]